MAQGEDGFFEFFVGAVEEEAQGTSTGGGVVDDFCHEFITFAEVQFVADTYLTGGVYQHIP